MSEEKKDEAATEAKESTTDAAAHVEDAARTGIKEIAKDAEAMAMEKDKPKIEPVKPSLPSFFVDKEERRKIEVDILSSMENGKILSVTRTGLGLDLKEFEFLRHDVAEFYFSVPTYEEMSTYRQRCGVYRREAGQILVDRIQLRNHLLVWHLKDWNLTDKDGKKVEFAFDPEGSLSDESLKKVYAVHATVVDVVLTILEKELLLT
jgi:hypothetical protein